MENEIGLSLRSNSCIEFLYLPPIYAPLADPPSLETGVQVQTSTESDRIKKAVKRLEQRYQEVDTILDVTESDRSGPRPDYFIYRQPFLNRATWEFAPQRRTATLSTETRMLRFEVDNILHFIRFLYKCIDVTERVSP
jgi:hypothetical protein